MAQDKQAEGLKEFKEGNLQQWLGFYEKAAEHYKAAAQAFAAALAEKEEAR